MTTPPFIGLIGAHLRKRRGVPYVLWCMDLYPEALAAHGACADWNPLEAPPARLAREERAGRRRRRPRAGHGRLLEASGAPRVETFPSGAVSAHAGSAGRRAPCAARAAGPTTTSSCSTAATWAAPTARRNSPRWPNACAGQTPRCRFVFAGDGPQRAEWERNWGGSSNSCRRYRPARPCAAHLLAADVHLVSQQPEWMGVVVPSKFPGRLRLGPPVVFAGPPQSAVGQWLAEADAGWLLPPGDAAAMEWRREGIPMRICAPSRARRRFRLFRTAVHAGRECGRLAELIESAAKERTMTPRSHPEISGGVPGGPAGRAGGDAAVAAAGAALGILDRPGERKIHRQAVPRGGGSRCSSGSTWPARWCFCVPWKPFAASSPSAGGSGSCP
jgi:hypothetical protein